MIMWLSKFSSVLATPDYFDQYACTGSSEHFVLGMEKLVTSSPLHSVCFFTFEGLTWDDGSNDVSVFWVNSTVQETVEYCSDTSHYCSI